MEAQGELFPDQWLDVLKASDADVSYFGGFLAREEADRAFAAAAREQYVQESITIHGRTHDVPRLTMWYSEDGSTYTYSGIAMQPRSFPPFVREMNARIARETGLYFNSVLINFYRDGNDKVGWHSDDEKELGDEIHIASVSLGIERVFRMRHRNDHSRVVDCTLGHGSLLVMRDPTQLHWEHCLPPRKRIAEPRYNLTFRTIRP
ncbi:MAG: alpha-ketoglutarate-dependent dioxygenase AlkB [Gammaproteobacteria bacterium]|nr:alpha-ketoglutarate-dependent dioxygenase AlkB [Gammaproteobacteria bacterium]